MTRRLVTTALVLLALALVAFLTFPTDALVRALLDRVPLPGDVRPTFADVHLRPGGIVFGDLHVVRRDGESAFDATWLRVRPSILGFWRDRTGRPWRLAAATCQGRIDVTLDAVRDRTAVALELDQIELATCVPYLVRALDVYGRVSGTTNVRFGRDGIDAGEGALEIRGAAWTPALELLQGARIRADAGTLRWRLADRRLEVTTLGAESGDFRMVGNGTVRLVTPVDDSILDLRLTVTPGPTMPPLLRRHLDAIPGAVPDARGTRTLRVTGSLRDPRIGAPGKPG